MADHALLLQTIFALSTVAAAAAVGLLYRHRKRTGATALLAMMGGVTFWNGCLLVTGATENATVAILALRAAFIGVAVVSLLKFVFALQYTGREHLLQSRFLVPLAVPPVLLAAFAFLNPFDLFFATLEPTASALLPITFEFGPAVTAYYVYAYALNVAVTALLLGFIYRSSTVYRGQSLALLGGTLAPWITVIVYVTGLSSIDLTPIGSALAGVLFTVVIVRYRRFDIMPIARDRVLDNVNDGVFVIDTEDRLVDVNDEGRRMLETVDAETEDLVGRRFQSLFDDPDLRERYETAMTGSEGTTEQVSIGAKHFEVRTTPIDDGRDRHVGWLLIAHDVTERERRQEQLEAQNERLDRFASLVSHDLRNPLNVADGYLELASETADNDEYLDEIEKSYDRMETIIEDVLALAREGEAVTDPEPVKLDALADEAWNGVETGAASIAIDADVSILADPDRTRRLLENLFRNALEHATDRPDGSDLEIAVGPIGEGANGAVTGFYVADDGIGIPACRTDQVLEDGYTTGENGTGLGLSIVESIAAAHDWSVAVTESEAGGARFEFRGIQSAADPSVTESAAASSDSGEVLPR